MNALAHRLCRHVSAILLAAAAAGCDASYIDAPKGSGGSPKTAADTSATAPSDTAAPAKPQTTDLYHSAKGNPKDQAVVFIHGGPGANSEMFELTVQDAIAKLGYYVVAYDQRGSTRSPKGIAADYSYAKATQDLDDLIGALGLEKPILVGHSFGGTIALQYLERFKGKAKGAVLVATPMSFPKTYDTSLAQCAARFEMWGRTSDAADMTALRTQMFPNGVTPPYAFTDANIDSVIGCQNDAKLYFPEFPTKGELSFGVSGGLGGDVADVNPSVGSGYQANDQVGYADFTDLLKTHQSEVRGIYAPDWDVMFSKEQLQTIQTNMASFATVSGSGHFIFVDQPDAFVTTLGGLLGETQ